jgi:predicted O-linked N-acetylglucosamine transferase (SPINDLY family)
MGLPVLTCIGHSFASRVAASLLNAVNLPELITTTQEQYESLAIELATNPEKLKIIKDKLVDNLPTAPLYDTPLFARHLESAYLTMYDRYQNGLDPDHIYVEH